MRLALLLATVLLAACARQADTPPSARQQAQRKAVAEATVEPRRYHVPEGDLIVLPVPMWIGRHDREVTHCFVWRDRELGTATLSCAPSSGLVD